MPALTTADIAFLICSSLQQKDSAPRPRLSLQTSYGLIIRLGANGSLSADLDTDGQPTPTTPNFRSKHVPFARPASTSIDEILHGPISPQAFNLAFPLSNAAPVKKSPLGPGQGYKYRIYPDKHGASHVWYSPGWPGNPYPVAKRVRELDLEIRYPGAWFEAYLDWAERLEEAMERRDKQWDATGKGQGQRGRREPLFVDDGEKMLWMVEGLLLASWLSLQPDVGGVEYQPAGEVFVLEKGALGRILRKLMSGGSSS